jgi:UDP:flavonoid glycosyltransferase YjiC (YdhE family)
MFVTAAQTMADDAVRLTERLRPDLVVYEPRAYAGQIAAGSAGVPAVRHLYGTDYTYGRWVLERPVVEPLFHRYGLAADPAGTVTVDPCPPVLQVATAENRRLMRYVPYNGPGIVPRWLRDGTGRSRICVTWGTTSGTFLGHLRPVHDVIAAVCDQDVEVLVAIRAEDRPRLGPVPGTVRVVSGLPLHLLLPYCAAIVHQGGAGTTITSYVCGVPQLVLPFIADQFVNGEQVARAGAGRCLYLRDATPEAVRSQVTELLAAPSYRAAARSGARLACRAPSPATVAEGLCELATGTGASASLPDHHRDATR